MAKKDRSTEPESEEFKNMVALLAVYSEASNRLEEMQSQANKEYLELLDDKRDEYAELQETLTRTEAALELIAIAHPEWFAKKRSIKTAYGTVKLHSSTKLEVPNEEATILLIQHEIERIEADSKSSDQATRQSALDALQDFNPRELIRTTESLNLEALGALPDAVLKRFRITRVPNDNFSVSPAKVDMGKAVKEALSREAA